MSAARVAALCAAAGFDLLDWQVAVVDRVFGATPALLDMAAEADAWTVAILEVARRREPVYQLPAAGVDVINGLDPATAAAALALRLGTRLVLDELPGPTPGESTTVAAFVEGTTETVTLAPGIEPAAPRRITWRLALNVSDAAVAGIGIRWADVDPATRWADVDPAVDWLDTGRMETDAALTR
ncbi:hypothetical protein [Nocardioides pantholopis]|uniref:hypothetical protein n=1 Tax=Nocardioides pantholopis TaxID=2483798 RepID=UPI000FD75394|nr:hypothetical protein [Nocardioides pantholopis]